MTGSFFTVFFDRKENNRETIDHVLDGHQSGRYGKQITGARLVWLIIGFGLFAGKVYRHLYRLIVRSTGKKLPARVILCKARKRKHTIAHSLHIQ